MQTVNNRYILYLKLNPIYVAFHIADHFLLENLKQIKRKNYFNIIIKLNFKKKIGNGSKLKY